MLALAEFAVESIIREGINDIKTDNIDIRLEDILGRLQLNDLATKFGSAELDKFKTFILRGDIHVVHSLTQLKDTELPSFSIHLLSDSEDDSKAGFADTDGETEIEVEPAVIVATFTANSYDPTTGKVSVADSINLIDVYGGRIYIDGDGNRYTVNYPLSNVDGDRYFTIDKDLLSVNLTDGRIESSVDVRIFETKYTATAEQIMIGVHADNALLTKYLYYALRYILYRKRNKFQEYQLQLSKYNGSDFILNQNPMLPDKMHSRWITAQFTTYNFWHGDELVVIDAIQPTHGGFSPMSRIVFSFDPTTYDPSTGIVTVPDSVDLSEVIDGNYFIDASGHPFEIVGGVNNTTGSKQFKIGLGQTVDLNAGASIRRVHKLRVEGGSRRVDEVDYTWESEVPEDSE